MVCFPPYYIVSLWGETMSLYYYCMTQRNCLYMSLYYHDTAVLIFGILPFGWLNKRAKPLSSLHQQDLFALHEYHMALHFNLLINSVSINITPAGFRTTHRQPPKAKIFGSTVIRKWQNVNFFAPAASIGTGDDLFHSYPLLYVATNFHSQKFCGPLLLFLQIFTFFLFLQIFTRKNFGSFLFVQ